MPNIAQLKEKTRCRCGLLSSMPPKRKAATGGSQKKKKAPAEPSAAAEPSLVEMIRQEVRSVLRSFSGSQDLPPEGTEQTPCSRPLRWTAQAFSHDAASEPLPSTPAHQLLPTGNRQDAATLSSPTAGVELSPTQEEAEGQNQTVSSVLSDFLSGRLPGESQVSQPVPDLPHSPFMCRTN